MISVCTTFLLGVAFLSLSLFVHHTKEGNVKTNLIVNTTTTPSQLHDNHPTNTSRQSSTKGEGGVCRCLFSTTGCGWKGGVTRAGHHY
jgi:hypothetical protein